MIPIQHVAPVGETVVYVFGSTSTPECITSVRFPITYMQSQKGGFTEITIIEML